MNKITLFQRIALIIFLINSGCQKLEDYAIRQGRGNAAYKICTIRSITVDDAYFPGDITHYTFAYDKWGNPVSIITDQVGTGNPNVFFYYDASHRLSQMLRAYDNNAYETWTKYTSKGNQVIFDTTYIFGDLINGKPLPVQGTYRTTEYSYDKENRISKTISKEFEADTMAFSTISNYYYDRNGDLAGGGFDTALSLLRTNDIWMFIEQNYSVNNRFNAITYNEHLLPLQFRGAPYSIIAPKTGTFTVEYDCGRTPKAQQ